MGLVIDVLVEMRGMRFAGLLRAAAASHEGCESEADYQRDAEVVQIAAVD